MTNLFQDASQMWHVVQLSYIIQSIVPCWHKPEFTCRLWPFNAFWQKSWVWIFCVHLYC